ncbi:MAG: hypothetical protein ACT4PL_00110 [Phycisphaerales bacterium]
MTSQRPTIKPSTSLLSGAFPKLTYRYRQSANDSVRALLHRVGAAGERRWVRNGLVAVLAVLFCGGGALAYLAFVPRPVPDVMNDPFEDVLDYTLLSDDFNQLPLEKRLAIIKELISRLKSMDSGDSAMMSAFAAGIMGKARDQLRKNAEKMAVDMWDAFATDYEKVSRPEDREAYLDDAFVKFTEMMEDVSGFKSDMKPEDRLAQGRKQASRDMERMRDQNAPMKLDRVNTLMKTIHERGDSLAKPEQRSRMAKFSRDMTRHLRGQDVNTGKPKPGGPGSGEGAPEVPVQPPATPGR